LRIDLFLKTVGLFKTRAEAKRALETGRVLVAGRPVKPSHELSGGEDMLLKSPFQEVRVRVLAVPPNKSVARADRKKYVIVETSEVQT